MPASVVLIETLWNVKVNVSRAFLAASVVLIETLWNVKQNIAFLKLKITMY